MNTLRRFLTLGDSYTVGEGVDSVQSWPAQLVVSLRQNGIPIDEPVIIAQTGWTTTDLLAAVEAADLPGSFDLVSLLIGVNNQYQGGDMETYRDEFRMLLGRALNFTEGNPATVLGLSIPDWGVTPFNEHGDPSKISAEIDAFNHINQKECQAVGGKYVDITPTSRLAGADTSLLTSDNLHPSGKMYAAWVELMLPAVLRVLQT
jgi:lysophospholipase L1-like esterase